jgi:copper chaperone CopZ
MEDLMETQYLVEGMTCQHCVAHVTHEVSTVPGVDKVEVSLDGKMVITSQAPLDFAAIASAVCEAGGYSISG